MKKILVASLLLSVANCTPLLPNLGGRFMDKLIQPHRHWFQPPGHSFTPPGQSFEPPEHMHIPPGQMQIPQHPIFQSPCQLLDHLFTFQVKKQNSGFETCSPVWYCTNPKTGNTMLKDFNGIPLMSNEQFNLDSESSNKGDCNTGSSNNNNGNVNKEDPKTSLVHTPTPQLPMDEPPRNHGGEGLIDIRIGGS